jgi:hypothetical protein
MRSAHRIVAQLGSGAVTKLKRVRSEPGGLVDLTFTDQGWTATQIQGSRPDPAQWCAIGMGAALLLALLAGLVDLDVLVKPLLVVAGVLLAAAVILVGLDFLGTLVGVAWMTGSALTRGGRRKLRQEAKGIVDDLMEVTRGPEFFPADRVLRARILREVRGTAVELMLDDGSTRRYLRRRAGLVEPFQRLLGDRLVPS